MNKTKKVYKKYSGKRLSTTRTKVTRVAAIVLCVLLVLSAVGYAAVQYYLDKINYEEPGPDITDSIDPQAVSDYLLNDNSVMNVLLLGSDTRIDTTDNGYGLSDAMMIVSVSKITHRVVATSLLRDIYIPIPGYWTERLNAAYTFGGPDLLIETISQNFGIQIDRWACVNFYAFIDVVNILGGLDLEVTNSDLSTMNFVIREINRWNGSPVNDNTVSETGLQHLNGIQCLGYVRNRDIAGSDFGRTNRQREVLGMLFDLAKAMSIGQINNLLNVVLPNVSTNFTKTEIMQMIPTIFAIKDYEWYQWAIPMDGTWSSGTIPGKSVLEVDFEANAAEFNRLVYGTE